MQNFDLHAFIIGMVVIICSITLHEFGHAISADRLGDTGPRLDGRITLWPDKHFDPFGFIMIVVTTVTGFGLGWGKPVMVNPARFRHPNRDMMIVAAFGPLMNLILAVIAGLLLRYSFQTGHTAWMYDRAQGTSSISGQFAEMFLMVNLGLMFFNLIPIPPLDGSKILYGLLPIEAATRYERFAMQWGMLILMLLVFTRALGIILMPAVTNAARLLIGPTM